MYDHKKLAQTIDHTNLKAEATELDIQHLCAEAARHNFFSVCVNPCQVENASKSLFRLNATSVAVCTVVGFPLGANLPFIKARETELALRDGATEIDMVMNIGQLREGDFAKVLIDILEVRSAMDDQHILKVIIETGLLTNEQKRNAAQLVIDGGAAFVKTSTGTLKTSTGETKGAMRADIELLREEVGDQIKIKASGGISSLVMALAMIESGAARIGASRGVDILAQLPGIPLTHVKWPQEALVP